MELYDVIQSRRSIRAYKPDAVEADKLNRVLEAGRLAPTAANRQPVEILVITGAARQKLKAAYGREWCWSAPAVIVVCSQSDRAWTRSDGKCFADIDAAIVMDHIILAATAEGLGTCWIGAFDPVALSSALSLPEELEPVVLTPLGYPAESPAARDRRPLEAMVQHLSS